MNTRRKIYPVRPTLYFLILSGLSLNLAACGPESRQVPYLVSWAPDGSGAALVPDFLQGDMDVSGVWVYDCKTGNERQIVDVPNNLICAHPQWSPYGNELLFAVAEDENDHSSAGDESFPYSVYIVSSTGLGMRRVADGRSTGGDAFLVPNAISWGPVAGTIIYQQAFNDKVTAMQLSLATGAIRQYLPDVSDLYFIVPSPDRRRVAALLYDSESKSARLYVADMELGTWQQLEILDIDSDQIQAGASLIYWAPDSSVFVVPEKPKSGAGAETEGGFLRLFDARSGMSQRICAGDSFSGIFWNREGNEFVFAGNSAARPGIHKVDIHAGSVKTIVPGDTNQLLSWNHEDGRVYFIRPLGEKERRTGEEKVAGHRLFSCDEQGMGARSLGWFLIGKEASWSISPDGTRMMLFDGNTVHGLMNLTPGNITQTRLQ